MLADITVKTNQAKKPSNINLVIDLERLSREESHLKRRENLSSHEATSVVNYKCWYQFLIQLSGRTANIYAIELLLRAIHEEVNEAAVAKTLKRKQPMTT